jgi:hypothetical protein
LREAIGPVIVRAGHLDERRGLPRTCQNPPGMGRILRALGLLAAILVGLGYAFRWEYGNPRGIVQTRTNRWTGTAECRPSYPLLWTQVVKDKSSVATTAKTAGPCSVPEEIDPGGWVCKPHRVAAWGRCGD